MHVPCKDKLIISRKILAEVALEQLAKLTIYYSNAMDDIQSNDGGVQLQIQVHAFLLRRLCVGPLVPPVSVGARFPKASLSFVPLPLPSSTMYILRRSLPRYAASSLFLLILSCVHSISPAFCHPIYRGGSETRSTNTTWTAQDILHLEFGCLPAVAALHGTS